MLIELTKDADKLICLIYKEYLDRRGRGLTKRQARDFADLQKWPSSFRQKFESQDMADTLTELKNAGLVRRFICGGFQLEDCGVLYMERRFPDGLSQVVDWLGKVMSVIPFV